MTFMPLVDLNRLRDAVTWLFAHRGLLCWPGAGLAPPGQAQCAVQGWQVWTGASWTGCTPARVADS